METIILKKFFTMQKVLGQTAAKKSHPISALTFRVTPDFPNGSLLAVGEQLVTKAIINNFLVAIFYQPSHNIFFHFVMLAQQLCCLKKYRQGLYISTTSLRAQNKATSLEMNFVPSIERG